MNKKKSKVVGYFPFLQDRDSKRKGQSKVGVAKSKKKKWKFYSGKVEIQIWLPLRKKSNQLEEPGVNL